MEIQPWPTARIETYNKLMHDDALIAFMVMLRDCIERNTVRGRDGKLYLRLDSDCYHGSIGESKRHDWENK
jgi:hypothetical protein